MKETNKSCTVGKRKRKLWGKTSFFLEELSEELGVSSSAVERQLHVWLAQDIVTIWLLFVRSFFKQFSMHFLFVCYISLWYLRQNPFILPVKQRKVGVKFIFNQKNHSPIFSFCFFVYLSGCFVKLLPSKQLYLPRGHTGHNIRKHAKLYQSFHLK